MKKEKKSICDWTRKELKQLPRKKWDEYLECDSIIILPSRQKHSSGYLCMEFVAVKDNQPIFLMGGCSDVIHIEGIGGMGKDWLEKFGHCPKQIDVTGWSIDCLPNGLLRLWPGGKNVVCGTDLSSFEVWSKGKEK